MSRKTLPKINNVIYPSHAFKLEKCDLFVRDDHPDTRTNREWVADMKRKGFKRVSLVGIGQKQI